MELKYKIVDVEKMIDVFTTLSKERDANRFAKLVVQAQEVLSDYPVDIVEEFVKCVNDLESKNIPITKENFKAIEGYIMIRINFVEKGE